MLWQWPIESQLHTFVNASTFTSAPSLACFRENSNSKYYPNPKESASSLDFSETCGRNGVHSRVYIFDKPVYALHLQLYQSLAPETRIRVLVLSMSSSIDDEYELPQMRERRTVEWTREHESAHSRNVYFQSEREMKHHKRYNFSRTTGWFEVVSFEVDMLSHD